MDFKIRTLVGDKYPSNILIFTISVEEEKKGTLVCDAPCKRYDHEPRVRNLHGRDVHP